MVCYVILVLGEGDLLTGGDLYATVNENSLMQHHVALPPDAMGKITYIAPAGQYSLKTWPLRTPRPVAAKLAADTPLLTRQVTNVSIDTTYHIESLCYYAFCNINVFLMPYSLRYLVVRVQYLVHLAVGRHTRTQTLSCMLVVVKEEMKWQMYTIFAERLSWLGSGEEIGTKKAFSFCKLADFLLKVLRGHWSPFMKSLILISLTQEQKLERFCRGEMT
nr:V-type proton ATPase catalytic subunit A [Ipomoea batatas]